MEVDVVGVGGVVVIPLDDLPDHEGGHGGRDPLAGVDARLDPDGGRTRPGLVDLDDPHVPALVALADANGLDPGVGGRQLVDEFVQVVVAMVAVPVHGVLGSGGGGRGLLWLQAVVEFGAGLGGESDEAELGKKASCMSSVSNIHHQSVTTRLDF